MNWLVFFFLGLAVADDEVKGKDKSQTSSEERAVELLINGQPEGNRSPTDKLEDALISSKESTSKEKSEQFSEVDSFPVWWFFLGLLAIMGLIITALRRKNVSFGGIQVINRSYLGRDGSLAIIEVEDANMNQRRFLIGLNPPGSPSMLADLSPVGTFPEFEDTPSRLNIAIGEPDSTGEQIKQGKELLSEVLTERAKFEELQSSQPRASRGSQSKSPQKKPVSKKMQSEKSGGKQEDPWLKGIEEALGKNG